MEGKVVKPPLCFGEVIIDFLNTGFTSVEGLELADFRQFPGGAPANVAVAFAQLGGRAKFAGQVGGDVFGDFLEKSLVHYRVDIKFLHKHPTAHTALAFVSLDADGDRSFSFYRDRTADLLFSIEQVSDNWFVEHPVFHICSNTLTNADIAAVSEYVLERASRAGCTISVDANLRPGLWPNGRIDRSQCNAAVRSANFVKFSKEEIELLANGDENRYVDDLLAGMTRLIVVTDEAGPVEYFTRQHRGRIATPTVDVVNTTAAGDAFTADVLRGLCAASGLELVVSDPKSVEALIEFAIRCGSLTATRAGAFQVLPVFSDVMDFWTDMP